MSWIFSIVALVVALGLRGRVKYLEETVKKLSGDGVSINNGAQDLSSTPQPSTPNTTVVSQPIAPVAPSPSFQPQASTYVDPITLFFRWFAIDWPMKLGAILLFLSVGWIVTVVFWDAIGPVGQVTLGFVLGTAILFFGAKRIEVSGNQGSVLLGLGAGIIYFTIFAARTQYGFFSPAIALAFMFFVTVFVAFISVVRRNFPVALLGLVLGGIAPLLTNSPVPSIFGLFSYLFILSLGTLWVVRLTGWRKLTIAAIALYGLYAVPILVMSHINDPDHGAKMLVAIVFSVLFFVASIISVIHDRKAEPLDLVVSLINGLILLGWINTIIPPEWQSFMAVLIALASTTGAFAVYSLTDLREPVYIHSAVAGVFIGMATAYELSGSMLVIAYILETSALVLGARFALHSEVAARKAALVVLLPVILSFESLGKYALSRDLVTKDFFAILLMSLMFFLLSFVFRQSGETTSGDLRKGMFFSVVGSLYAFVLIWLSTHILFSDDQATMFSLFVYTLVGMIFYIKGKMAAEKNQRVYGAALLLFVTGHLFLVDVGGMDVMGRIATFSIVGILFMSTAFIGRKKIE